MIADQGGVIARVAPGSVGEEVGIEPGDRLVSINGVVLRDVVDYQFYGAEECLDLVVERTGERHNLHIERDLDEKLGLEFSTPLFDGLRECANHCPFCFVRQMPRGMRRTLCLRDDDYRLSFLQGNYVTLTNLDETDWQRIAEQRLSPLYVSVHATDAALRRRLLGNPDAPDVLEQIERLAGLGLSVNAQIVVVPEWNDGEALRRSIDALGSLWPTVRSLAVVPVGLTRYHRGGLRVHTPEEAGALLDLVDAMAAALRRRLGCTWVYPSDELYLLAGRAVPEAAFYDDDAQRENGVGLVRELLDDWASTRSELTRGWRLGRRRRAVRGRVTLVCATLIAPLLRDTAADLATVIGQEIVVLPVENRFFGSQVTVSGLLTGTDVLAALEDVDLGDLVVLPEVMFTPAEGEMLRVTLDEQSIAALAAALGTRVALAATLSDVADAILGRRAGRR